LVNDNKSDITLLVNELVNKVDLLHDDCIADQLPNSKTIKDLIRLTSAIDKLCFTIDNYRYLKEQQYFNR
jgi:hypothetical protein